MNSLDKLWLGGHFFKTLVSGLKRPLFVSWLITERCNLRCSYCGLSPKGSAEIDTACCKEVIGDLRSLGTRVIRFTGGEPLLREDLPELIACCHRQGILTGIATNGILFPERVDSLRGLSTVSFSLDGSAEVHDSLRGLGTYQAVLKALEIAKRKRIYTTIAVSLNRQNLGSVDHILDLAKIFRVKVFFQPVTDRVNVHQKCGCLSPDPVSFRKVIEHLIKEKRRNRFIGNSAAGLRHLSRWPEETPIHCLAGRVICRIGSDGQVYACPAFRVADLELNVGKRSFKECFNRLSASGCENCWCSLLVELNLMGKPWPQIIFGALAK